MMKPRLRKVFRDLTSGPGRNLLLVVAIALGVFGIGGTLGTYAVMNREMPRNYLSTAPASATIVLEDREIDSAIVDQIAHLPQIQNAERRGTFISRMRVGDDWLVLLLFVIDDFELMKTNKFFHVSGKWPPPEGTMLIEQSALRVIGHGEGSELVVRVPRATAQTLKISGVVHDPGLAPAWQERAGYGYVTGATFKKLGGTRAFNEVRITVKNQDASASEIRVSATEVADFLARNGYTVREVRVPPPGRHPHQGQMNAVLMTFIVFSFLILIFAAILVATSIYSLMTRQIREIGVMKTIGASSSQIAVLYVLTLFVLSSVAVAIAIPLSRLAASLLINSSANMLNLQIYDSSTPPVVALTQIAAGIFIPLLAAFFPILRGARISVREALSNYGASQSAFGETRLESLLARLQMFGTTFLLSARNVFRQRSRLILTLGMLAAGGGMFMGSLNLSRAWDSNVDRIYRERLYDLELQFAAPLQSPMKTADHLQEIPGVTLAEPWQSASMALGRQRKFETTHAYPDGGHGRSVMFAVPPNTRLVRFPLTEGKWLQSDNENEVVLNENARDSDSNLKPGDMVSIFVKGKTTRWKISGFVQDLGTPGATAYVPLAAYQRAVGQNGCCNLIRVAFKDRSPETTQIRTRQVENVLEKDGEVVAYSLQMFELREAISEHTTVLIRSLLALAVLMAAVGGIGLTSTMSMNILERRRELGVMRAIGATPAKVARVIVGEGLMIGILSLVLAFTLSLLLSGFLGNFIGNMAFRTPLPLKVSLMGLAEWIAIVVCGSILATIFPARSAGTITIREALAYE